MHDKILGGRNGNTDTDAKANRKNPGAFLAALDQSGGSTPGALSSYGLTPEEGNYEVGTESMFDAVHQMRTRIMESPSFRGDSILGAILFEDTMDRTVCGQSTCRYLWEQKGIVPFLKIDKGLDTNDDDNDDGDGASVRMLLPIPDLESLLDRAYTLGVYGTKARSLVLNPRRPHQIDALVRQQFDLARRVLARGLVPIVEPEVAVCQASTADKKACEEILCRALLRELDRLAKEGNGDGNDCDGDGDGDGDDTTHGRNIRKVLIKITLPETPNQYGECVDHTACLGVVALSGGYSRETANAKLAHNRGVVASFSRALSEGLSHSMTDDEFDAKLSDSIGAICEASAAALVE